MNKFILEYEKGKMFIEQIFPGPHRNNGDTEINFNNRLRLVPPCLPTASSYYKYSIKVFSYGDGSLLGTVALSKFS